MKTNAEERGRGKTHIVTREVLGMYIDPEASQKCGIHLETLVQQVLKHTGELWLNQRENDG